MNYMWFGRSLSQSVDDPRLHHQLVPMYIQTDAVFPFNATILQGLKDLGHQINKTFIAVVQAVIKNDDDLLYGKCDPRKGGYPAGF